MTTTDTHYRNAKPREKLYDITDSDVKGLALRIHPTGTKTWAARLSIKHQGRVRREIGGYPSIGVAEARRMANEWRYQASQGIDPHGHLTAPKGLSLQEAVEDWLADVQQRSAGQIRRRFELHVYSYHKLASVAVTDISQQQIAQLLRHLRTVKGLTAEVNRVRSSLGALYSWLIRQGEVVDNPALRTSKIEEPSQARALEQSTRVLTLDELKVIWAASDHLPPIPRALIRLLILIPLRREEWTEASASEIVKIDGYTCLSLAATRMKGKRPHVVPLSDMAIGLVKTVPRHSDFLFSVDGTRPYKGWKRASQAIQEAAALNEHWVIHDLRRGAATQLGEMGAPENLVSRILAHSPSRFMGVTSQYDRSKRIGDMANILSRWANRVSGSEAQVIPLSEAIGAKER